jgi:hypothetical protein
MTRRPRAPRATRTPNPAFKHVAAIRRKHHAKRLTPEEIADFFKKYRRFKKRLTKAEKGSLADYTADACAFVALKHLGAPDSIVLPLITNTVLNLLRRYMPLGEKRVQ